MNGKSLGKRWNVGSLGIDLLKWLRIRRWGAKNLVRDSVPVVDFSGGVDVWGTMIRRCGGRFSFFYIDMDETGCL